jgi:xylose isomerase
MTEFFAAVSQPVAPASAPAGDGLRYLVYDPQRVVAGRTMAEHLRIAVCYWHSFNWPGSDVFGAGTFDRPWLAAGGCRRPPRRWHRTARVVGARQSL